MYRRGRGELWSRPGATGDKLVAASHNNRVAAERRTRHQPPPTSTLSARLSGSRLYGPTHTGPARSERDRKKWEWMYKDEAKEDERLEKQKKDKQAEKRITKEEAGKIEALTIKSVDFHISKNALDHHTHLYHCGKGENAQLVLRRGQEFTVTFTFNRQYDVEKDDLLFIFDADDDNPSKSMREEFKLDEKDTSVDEFQKNKAWGGIILASNPVKHLLKVAVYIPVDCVVGEWDLKVKTKLLDKVKEDFTYLHPSAIIVLFNPWCEDDQVYMKDQSLLKEYILNAHGSVYSGLTDMPGSRPWTYGQFEKEILHICLSLLRKAFGFKMTPVMADAVMVARALSRIVNCSDDNGVLVGNWTGDYSGGEPPMSWKTSTAILRKYEDTGKPVKYGQCWVFSHVLTTVCRALGLPCRSVTTFDSAHDTDNTCTIDRFFTKDGEELKHLKSDSVWNFHVWNDVWLMRPDLSETGDYDGWHAIDATPQEMSNGVYQCGPSPVQAIKRGEITVGYDTAFVFGEVNADRVDWIVDENEEIFSTSNITKNKVGSRILTKPPDGKAHKPGLSWQNVTDASLADDITHCYKFPEGTEEERKAVEKALRFTKHGKRLYKEGALEVTFGKDCHPSLADEDFQGTALVKNVTSVDRDITMVFAVRTCSYWNQSHGDHSLAKVQYDTRTIKAGETEEYKVTVKTDECLDKCDEQLSFFAYACAMDLKTNMPYSQQHPYRVRRPDLEVAGPEKAKTKEVVTMTASMTNPLRVPLTACQWQVEGDLYVADDDKNDFELLVYSMVKQDENLKAGEKRTLTVRVYGEIADDQESGVNRSLAINFSCKEIKAGAKGAFVMAITKR